MDEKLRTIIVRPDRSRNGELIEHPDSWRKIRRTGAMVDRQDVRGGLSALAVKAKWQSEIAVGRFADRVAQRAKGARRHPQSWLRLVMAAVMAASRACG